MAGAVVQVVIALITVAATLGLYLYCKRCKALNKKYAGIHCPPIAIPLLGHMPYMFGPMSTILERGLSMVRKYGEPFEPFLFWMGERPWVHLYRPDHLELVLGSPRYTAKPDMVYKPVSGFFGWGLITLSGDKWLQHRRVLTPAFHFAILERYSTIFTRRAAAFADRLAREQPRHVSFNFVKYTSTFVTDTIMETAFGISEDSGAMDEDEVRAKGDFVHATEVAFDIIARRIMQPWLMVDFLFRLSPWGRKQVVADRVIDAYAQRVIQLKKRQIAERRAAPAPQDTPATDAPQDDDDGHGVREKFTFLDLVLDRETELLSDEEILQEVRTLIAVQQTSATTLGFLVVMLALHPEVQARVREEVVRVDAERLSAIDRLKSLKYLERVIKETIRLYPVTSLFARELKEDLPLGDKLVLPAGTGISILPLVTHRNPNYWPDPEAFDPDRFLPENCVGRHPYAYIPFSAGPRNCIGQRYAMLQMKAVVAGVVRRFSLLPGAGCERMDRITLNMDTFLHIPGGFNVVLSDLSEVE